MTANPCRSAIKKWHDRYLHHRISGKLSSIQRQFLGVHMILGIVEDDADEAKAFGALILSQGGPKSVEIVALRRRAILRADY